MTRYEAYIEKNWREHGLAHVVVTRVKANGLADYGVFLTDVWCLGVKDAFAETDVPAPLMRELAVERLPETMREPIHPACAKKLIEGALAYAKALGFSPHRDFRRARHVLSGIDASHCPEVFTYGRDGRPCYVRGVDDSDQRVERVLAILDTRVGPGGYDYDLVEKGDALAQRDELMKWLDAEPDNVPRFYAFSGMVTALHVCPGVVMPTQLLDALWGAEGREWKDEDEVRRFTDLLRAYWNHAGDLVHAATAPDADPEEQPLDVWSDDFAEENPIFFLGAMKECANGFLRTTELWPDAWEDALTRPDLAEHWEAIRWWAGFETDENRENIRRAVEVSPPRTLGRSIVALARALKPAASA